MILLKPRTPTNMCTWNTHKEGPRILILVSVFLKSLHRVSIRPNAASVHPRDPRVCVPQPLNEIIHLTKYPSTREATGICLTIPAGNHSAKVPLSEQLDGLCIRISTGNHQFHAIPVAISLSALFYSELLSPDRVPSHPRKSTSVPAAQAKCKT